MKAKFMLLTILFLAISVFGYANTQSKPSKNYSDILKMELQPLEQANSIFSKKEKYVILGLINIGVNVALRYSDLSELKFEDITYENTIKLFEEKTNKKKEVKLNKFCVEEIKKLKEYYHNLKIKNWNKGYIFKSLSRNILSKNIDRNLTIQSFNRYLKEAQRELKISYNIGSHSLRKTWGKFYYEKYKDIATVMKILNHSSIESTLRYIGIDRKRLHKIYEDFII